MPIRDVPGPRPETAGRPEKGGEPSLATTRVRRHGPVHGFADDLGDRDPLALCFRSEAPHLLSGKGDLRSDHGPDDNTPREMITLRNPARPFVAAAADLSLEPPGGLEPPTRTLGRCRSVH